MTQPPDDAALVATETWAGIRMVPAAASPENRNAARKTELFRHGDMLLRWVNEGDLMVADMAARRAATALEAKDRRIADLEAALNAIEVTSFTKPGSAYEMVKIARRVLPPHSLAALEPSDKGVDHVHPE